MKMLIRKAWDPIRQALIFIGKIQTTLIMGVTYCAFIGPIALLYQFFHRQKHWGKTYWVKREPITDVGFYLRKQF